MPKFYRFEKDGQCVDVFESFGRFYLSDSFPLSVANEFLPLTGGDSLRIWTQSIMKRYWEDMKNARMDMAKDGWKIHGSGNEKPIGGLNGRSSRRKK